MKRIKTEHILNFRKLGNFSAAVGSESRRIAVVQCLHDISITSLCRVGAYLAGARIPNLRIELGPSVMMSA